IGAPPAIFSWGKTSQSISPKQTIFLSKAFGFIKVLLNFFQGSSFGFRHPYRYPNQLDDHHHPKESENSGGTEAVGKERKDIGDYCSQYPMSKAANGLSIRPQFVGENFGNKNPDHAALADGMGGNK